MRINRFWFSAGLLFVVFLSACKKDGDGDYIRASVNGNSWKSEYVTVETVGNGSGVSPTKITGVFSNEMIRIGLADANPGNYPFRLGRINPAVLVSFTAEYFESSHKVKWSTANEVDVASFEVQSSSDGINWIVSGTANATGGSSNYELVTTNDAAAGATSYYRLKVIDTDGKIKYSSIVILNGNFITSYRPPSDIDRRGYDGNLEIVTHDRGKKVITGRFHFKAKSSAGQVYTVTNGEFKATY